MKNFKIIAIVLVLGLILLGVFIFNKKTKQETTKPIVSVSSFYLYDIAKHIAGDTLEIVNILPFGVDPHSFELTPKIMADIEKSSLVFYSGAGLEPWVSRVVFKSKAIDVSKYVKLRELGSHELECHHHEGHDEEEGANNRLDPHYWLDFSNMKKATRVVTKELIRLSPSHKDMYIKNQNEYLSKLDKLDVVYVKHLKSCKIKDIVLNHNALGYLADRYHFHSASLSGLSPEIQPTPDNIKRIINTIKKDGIHTIFFENFVNSKVMKTIAKDAKVKVEVIQSLGNITADDLKENSTYESLMYKNLDKISEALECH